MGQVLHGSATTSLQLVWHRENTSPVIAKAIGVLRALIEEGAFSPD